MYWLKFWVHISYFLSILKSALPFVHNVGLPNHLYILQVQNSLIGLLQCQSVLATFSLIFAMTEPADCERAELNRIKQHYFLSKDRTNVSNLKQDVSKKMFKR